MSGHMPGNTGTGRVVNIAVDGTHPVVNPAHMKHSHNGSPMALRMSMDVSEQ